MNGLIYPKVICQSALGFQLTTAYGYYKQSPFSILGTRSECRRQCSCALCTIFILEWNFSFSFQNGIFSILEWKFERFYSKTNLILLLETHIQKFKNGQVCSQLSIT